MMMRLRKGQLLGKTDRQFFRLGHEPTYVYTRPLLATQSRTKRIAAGGK